jgi:hypothetical protein
VKFGQTLDVSDELGIGLCVVTSNGRPVGELRPLHRDCFVDSVAVVEVFRPAPRLDWQRTLEDIDQQLDQDIEPRL